MQDLNCFHFDAMGADCVLYLYADPVFAAQVADLAINEVHRIQQKFSRYQADSFLSKINQAANLGRSIELDDESAQLLEYGFRCYELSDGLFDLTSGKLREVWHFQTPQLPDTGKLQTTLDSIGMDKLHWQSPSLAFSQPEMELDFGGIGKEYAVDRVADICLERGIDHGLIDLGGDIRVLGPHLDGKPWEIMIRHPRVQNQAIRQVCLTKGAIATSGDYERYCLIDGKRYNHILNPKTGWPVTGWVSVSVIAEQCMVAGALSTIAMLKGADGQSWLDSQQLPYLGIDDRLQLHGADQSFTQVSSC